MDKIYLIIRSESAEYESWVDETLAFKNKPDAEKMFNKLVESEIEHAEIKNWKIESRDGYFSSYESGCYNENHVDITLQELELL